MRTRTFTITIALSALLAGIACEPEALHGPASAPQTSRLGISRDGKTLYVALADHDEVRAVDADSGSLRGQVDVPGYPHRLTVLKDGRVAVVSRYAGTLSVVDVEGGHVDSTVDVGSDPFGVVEVDGSVWVAVGGENDLARVDLKDADRVAERVTLAHQMPRGIARTPDGKLLISHSIDGALSVVDPRSGRVSGDVDMHLPSRKFFQPTQQDAITVSDDGSEVAVPHVECNNDPAQFGAGGTDLAGAAAQYYVEGPTGYPAVVPAVSRADVDNEVLLSDDSSKPDPSTGTILEQPGAVSPVINPLDRPLLEDVLVNAPTAVALAHGGDLELVVAKGSGTVLIRRSKMERGQSSVIGAVDVGVGADSIQMARNGERAYVYNAFDDTIVTFDLPEMATKQSKYADDGGRGSEELFSTRKEPLKHIKVVSEHKVADPVLPADVRSGRKMFFSVDEKMTRFGAVSCNSCHPNGAADSTTWQFAEGPRQSPPLWGGISDSAPFHWDSQVATLDDISPVTIQGRMGGTGLAATDMDKIGAYLDTIPAPSAPRTADGASVDRGADLFFSEATGCTTCHSGSDFSDGQMHDVSTGARFTPRETAVQFATPVLHGLAHSPPYLHDGSMKTLEQFVREQVRTNKMGHGEQLSDQDADDLVAFLRSM